MDYKKAGVDIEAGYKSVELMKKYVKETMRPEVLGGIGGFSGAFSLSAIKDMEDPVLLSGTDGVGTKLKLAFLMDKHDTIGIDCVAMCVNDVACAGGVPLFFLDYIACGCNIPEKIATIVKGVAEGCKQSDAALVGGETAEHPGLMPEDEYDLAGFAVGVVERKDLITGENIKPGDVLVGIASSGVHSNGFSLVRKVFDMTKESLDTYYDELGKTLGEALLAPTRIYVKAMKSVKNAGVKVKGCSHITGAGVQIFDGGAGTARETERRLKDCGLCSGRAQQGTVELCNSLASEQMKQLEIRLLQSGTIQIAQLHGQEDEAYAEELRRAGDHCIIRAFAVRSSEDIHRAFAFPADYPLLDNGKEPGKPLTGHFFRSRRNRFSWQAGFHLRM